MDQTSGTKRGSPRLPPVFCCHCIHWRGVHHPNKKLLPWDRKCVKHDLMKNGGDPSCYSFALSKLFWCHDIGGFIYVRACSRRHEMGMDKTCSECKRGSAIECFIRRYNKLHPPVPAIEIEPTTDNSDDTNAAQEAAEE